MKNNKKSFRKSKAWIAKSFFITLFISALFATLSNGILPIAPTWISILLILVFVLLGVGADTIAVAVAIASPIPFNSMSSRRVRGGKTAVWLVQNSDKVANITGDIIGDICAIISGGAVAILVDGLTTFTIPMPAMMIGVASFISALTVGLKAAGKSFAIKNANRITFNVALFISAFRRER